jgi:hypothetical protein
VLPNRTVGSVYHFAQRAFAKFKTGKWSPEDVLELRRLHAIHGSKWSRISKVLNRLSCSCRDKWRLIENQTTKTGTWSEDEDAKLVLLVQTLSGLTAPTSGVVWTQVARQMETRSHSACRNRWYNSLQRRYARSSNTGLAGNVNVGVGTGGVSATPSSASMLLANSGLGGILGGGTPSLMLASSAMNQASARVAAMSAYGGGAGVAALQPLQPLQSMQSMQSLQPMQLRPMQPMQPLQFYQPQQQLLVPSDPIMMSNNRSNNNNNGSNGSNVNPAAASSSSSSSTTGGAATTSVAALTGSLHAWTFNDDRALLAAFASQQVDRVQDVDWLALNMYWPVARMLHRWQQLVK